MFYIKKPVHMNYGVDKNGIKEMPVPLGAKALAAFGSTVIVAPHPDDESLACGGTIALLRKASIPVHVIFISDGSMSHPHSIKYPGEVLSALRESEAAEALSRLNVCKEKITFLRLKDSRVPFPGSETFAQAVETLQNHLYAILPKTMIIPWRRDPHDDHRASWHLAVEAIQQVNAATRILEYPLWLWERGQPEDHPIRGEVHVHAIDITVTLQAKLHAIAAHQSQVSRLIDDDPDGFWLSPEVIAHFTSPEEIFFEK